MRPGASAREDVTNKGAVTNGERSSLKVLLVVSELFEVDIDILYFNQCEVIEVQAK